LILIGNLRDDKGKVLYVLNDKGVWEADQGEPEMVELMNTMYPGFKLYMSGDHHLTAGFPSLMKAADELELNPTFGKSDPIPKGVVY